MGFARIEKCRALLDGQPQAAVLTKNKGSSELTKTTKPGWLARLSLCVELVRSILFRSTAPECPKSVEPSLAPALRLLPHATAILSAASLTESPISFQLLLCAAGSPARVAPCPNLRR